MTKTTIYLDVDGVINALSKNPPRMNSGWDGEWLQVDVKPAQHWSYFPMLISTQLLDELERLALRPDVEIRWLTTWTHDAPGALCQTIVWDVGTLFKVVDRPQADHPSSWWKLDAIQQDWDGESNIVWLDDDYKYMPDAIEWMRILAGLDNGIRTLGLSPNPNHGLSVRDIEKIDHFLGAVPEPGERP